jgi:redox-sensitive bicupin YhaK (pirin superfamily)
MITLRRSEDRRHITRGAHDTWMSFDPENHIDPLRSGFHTLESLNEEILGPEMSLYPHAEGETEILTYVREGTLILQEESGRMGQLGTGEFQHLSARRDLRHRAINGSLNLLAHVFQSCITPESEAPRPLQQQKRFPVAAREGILRLVASPDGREESLRIHQNVRVYSSCLLLGHHLIHELGLGRGAWLHVVKGRILLREHHLRSGDGAALDDEAVVSFTAEEPAEILLFDLA